MAPRSKGRQSADQGKPAAGKQPRALKSAPETVVRGPKKTKVTFYLDTEALDRIRAVCERSPFLTLGGVLSTVCQQLAPQLERLFPPENSGPVSRAIERACRTAAETHREAAEPPVQARAALRKKERS